MIKCPPYRPPALRPFYVKGCVEIYCGDSLEIIPLLNKRFDWCVCDPPYGTDSGRGYRRQQNRKRGDVGHIQNDENLDVFKSMIELLTPEKLCTFLHPKKLDEVIRLLELQNLNYRGEFIWNKKSGGLGSLRYSHESIFVASGEILKIEAHKTVFDAIAPARRKAHPHEKPLSVVGSLIEILKPESVIDPFLGSGTTAVACLERNIPFVGIESEIKWCELAAHRLNQDILL